MSDIGKPRTGNNLPAIGESLVGQLQGTLVQLILAYLLVANAGAPYPYEVVVELRRY